MIDLIVSVNQRIELDARDLLISQIFFRDEVTLRLILSNHNHGVPLIQKILSSPSFSTEERMKLAEQTKRVLKSLSQVIQNPTNYKKLIEELSTIPSQSDRFEETTISEHEAVSPLTSNMLYFDHSFSGTDDLLPPSPFITSLTPPSLTATPSGSTAPSTPLQQYSTYGGSSPRGFQSTLMSAHHQLHPMPLSHYSEPLFPTLPPPRRMKSNLMPTQDQI